MRVLLGIIFGAFLTVGAAYLYDSHNALANAQANVAKPNIAKPLVNWDVLTIKWNHLAQRAHAEWVRLAG